MTRGTTRQVTELLDAWSSGDGRALDQLIPLVVGDLRALARGYLAREGPGHTLEPTGLVNEAYLRLVGKRRVRFENPGSILCGFGRNHAADLGRPRPAQEGGAPW